MTKLIFPIPKSQIPEYRQTPVRGHMRVAPSSGRCSALARRPLCSAGPERPHTSRRPLSRPPQHDADADQS
jgi:hypothetical protein